jgi:hypothetical protein
VLPKLIGRQELPRLKKQKAIRRVLFRIKKVSRKSKSEVVSKIKSGDVRFVKKEN